MGVAEEVASPKHFTEGLGSRRGTSAGLHGVWVNLISWHLEQGCGETGWEMVGCRMRAPAEGARASGKPREQLSLGEISDIPQVSQQ